MSDLYQSIARCRACGRDNLESVWDLGEQYLADCLAPGEKGRRAPLVVVRCRSCGLAQLRDSVDRNALYAKYYYKSGTNETMQRALKDVADEALKYLAGSETGRVLDIGCNDGFLLSQFPARWLKVGVDPSNIEPEYLRGQSTATVYHGYFPEVARDWKRGGFDVISSVACFYDVEDPLAFMKEVKRLLRPDGVWINQMNTLGACMERNAFDFLSHEHLVYYTINDLCSLAANAGLECVDGEVLELNGGTARLVFKKRASSGRRPGSSRLVQLQMDEIKAGYTGLRSGLEAWGQLKARVDNNRGALRVALNSFRKGGVFVRGASTRGNSLLQYYRLSVDQLPYAADRDPAKWGKRMAGTDIPIISEAEAKGMNPQAFLLLPYSYLDQFMLRDQEWLLTGGKFILPLPEARVAP